MRKYLKPNVAIEPLFCSWYLWSYLIPPHTAGFFLKNRYLKTLRSFLEEPELHRLAAKNPKLAGGQFIDIEDSELKQIEILVNDTENRASHLLTLAKDIEHLDSVVQKLGDGSSLEPLYQQIPESLKGCIELVYDHNNHSKINFFEKVLYDKYFDGSLQSVMLTPLRSDLRKFVLATPRTATIDELMLPLRYDSTLLSKIILSRTAGINLDEIQDELSLDSASRKLLGQLFTDTSPCIIGSSSSYDGDGIRVRYFGHACVMIQTKEVCILIDPLISYFQPNGEFERFTLDDLPDKIDYLLFTHNHLDHISFETLLFLKNRVGKFIFQRSAGSTLINPDVRLILATLGFENLNPVDYLEDMKLPSGHLFSFPFLGEHGDLDIQPKSAFYIELLGHKFLFAADSNNLDNGLYEYLHQKVGEIDTVFIGMECVGGPLDWIYGPLLSKTIKHTHKQSRRYSGSDSKKALKLVETLKTKEVLVYAMGQEAWLSHITSLNYEATSPQIVESDNFIAECLQNKLPCKRLYGKAEWYYKD